ncbi:hypothetical protein [Flagellimonas profundi]|uniref:Uncharacterized protein n=1 Tax=Flagellimonas profundi TaxID=2915620 RepID=A0ABS3FKD3_9FLAO|nr:hypothetical protein [Allomuricauda profundi]MBO0343165.1 hypothetical protein [Allomuricauda profundi]
MHFFENLPEKLNLAYSLLAGTLFSQFIREDTVISHEAKGVLKNPADKILIDDTVQELKKDSSMKKKKITLSDDTEVVINIS